MKVSELKTILNNVPDDFDIKAIWSGIMPGGLTHFDHITYDVQGVADIGYSSNEILIDLSKGE